MNEEKVMTVKEVAELLNVSRTAVYHWIAAGLKGTIEKKIGSRRRMVFTEKDLLEYFDVDNLNELLTKRME